VLETKLRLQVIGIYLVARKWQWLIAAMVIIGASVGAWGSLEASTPSAASSGGSQVPIWRLLAVGSAVLPTLTLASPLQALEAAAGTPFYRIRNYVLGGAFAISSACMLAGAIIELGMGVGPLVARALVAWFGLALLSGRVLGWSYSWILPSAIMCVLLYWGHDRRGQDYRWWEFSAHPVSHLPSLIIAAILFVGGLVAYMLSPWRTYSAFRLKGGVGDSVT
jgi:hypothetical protein